MLSWWRGDPSRFKPFVRNRVAQIVELIPAGQWQHVPGDSNLADQASRGLYPKKLASCELWWKGPNWLHLPAEEWPEVPKLLERPLPIEEKESSQKVLVVVTQTELPLLERISSYSKIMRVTTWIFRFGHTRNSNTKEKRLQGRPTGNAEILPFGGDGHSEGRRGVVWR